MSRVAYLKPVETKSDGAFLTISEVATELNIPQHVLRFWETRFPQIKPLKMRGGRRYYRPEDVLLLHKIKTLLYSQGYTIKGAKKAINSGEVVEIETTPRAQQPVAVVPVMEAQNDTDVVVVGREELQSILSELYEMRELIGKTAKAG